jgi:hypothetical protein
LHIISFNYRNITEISNTNTVANKTSTRRKQSEEVQRGLSTLAVVGEKQGGGACNNAPEGDAGVHQGGGRGHRRAAVRWRGILACSRAMSWVGSWQGWGAEEPVASEPEVPATTGLVGDRARLRTPMQNSPGCLQSCIDSLAGLFWIRFCLGVFLAIRCVLDGGWMASSQDMPCLERGTGTRSASYSLNRHTRANWRICQKQGCLDSIWQMSQSYSCS